MSSTTNYLTTGWFHTFNLLVRIFSQPKTLSHHISFDDVERSETRVVTGRQRKLVEQRDVVSEQLLLIRDDVVNDVSSKEKGYPGPPKKIQKSTLSDHFKTLVRRGAAPS